MGTKVQILCENKTSIRNKCLNIAVIYANKLLLFYIGKLYGYKMKIIRHQNGVIRNSYHFKSAYFFLKKCLFCSQKVPVLETQIGCLEN